MGLDIKVAPDGFLRCLSKAERAKHCPGQLTAREAQEKFLDGEEAALQKAIDDYLIHVRPPTHTCGDPFGQKIKLRKMDKGRADRRICYRGRWISFEAKAGSRQQSADQKRNQASVEAAGGKYVVVHDLFDVQHALREIDAEIRVIQDAMRRDGWKEKVE